jgi:hypothetical protein
VQVSGGAAFRIDIGIGRSGIPVVTARDIYLPSDEPCLRSYIDADIFGNRVNVRRSYISVETAFETLNVVLVSRLNQVLPSKPRLWKKFCRQTALS